MTDSREETVARTERFERRRAHLERRRAHLEESRRARAAARISGVAVTVIGGALAVWLLWDVLAGLLIIFGVLAFVIIGGLVVLDQWARTLQ